MELLTGCSDLVAAWVHKRIPHMAETGFGACQAIGILSGGKLVAGVVFHQWQPAHKTIDISCAADSPKWASRRILHALWAYAFETCGVNRCTCITPTDATRVRKFLEGMGMVCELDRAKNVFGEQDASIYRLLKDEWKAGKFYLKDTEHEPRQGQLTETA